MKINIYFIILLLIGKFSFGQWTEIPVPTTNSLYSVDIHSSGVCYAAGIPLIKSTDNGLNWTEVIFTGTNALYLDLLVFNSVSIIDPNTTFVGGKQLSPTRPVIINSTDNGITWNYTVLNNSSGEIFGVDFYDNLNGIAVGSGGYFYKTSDGGATWIQIYSGSIYNTYTDVVFHTNNHIIAVGRNFGTGLISQSFDGGLTWVTNSISARSFVSIDYQQANNTFSTLSNNNSSFVNYLYTSTDNGNTWVEDSLMSGLQYSHELIYDTLYCGLYSGLKVRYGTNYFEFSPGQMPYIRDIEFNQGIGLAVSQYDGNVYRYDINNTPNAEQIVDFNFDDPYCEEDSLHIEPTNTGLDSYEWLIDGITVSNNQILNYNLPPNENGWKEFKLVTTYSGNVDTLIKNTYVISTPIVTDFTTNIDTTVCQNLNGHVINVYNLNNSTGYKLTRDGVEILPYSISGSTVSYNIGSYNTSFNITISKWNINNCDSVALVKQFNVNVDTFTDENQYFYALDTILCIGDSSQIVIPNPDITYEYKLYQNGLLVVTDTATTDTLFLNTNSINTNSDFTIAVVSPNGCVTQLLQNDSIKIDYVNAEFNVGVGYFLIDSLIEIDTTNIIGNSFNWSVTGNPSSFLDTLSINPNIIYNSTNIYELTLEVTSEYSNCVDTFSDTISIFNLAPDSTTKEVCWVKELDLPVILEKTVDLAGNVICVGYVRRPISFGYSNCAVIQKYNSDGILIWQYEHPNLSQSIHKSTMFGSVTTDNSGCIYITGSNETTQFILSDTTFYFNQFWGQDQHTYLLKLSPDGNFLWWNLAIGSTKGGFSDVLIDNNTIFSSINNLSGDFQFQNGIQTFTGTGLRIVKMDTSGSFSEVYFAGASYQSVCSEVQPEYAYPNRMVSVGPELFLGSDSILYISGETRGGMFFGNYNLTFSSNLCRIAYIAKLDVYNITTNDWLSVQQTSLQPYGDFEGSCTNRAALLSTSFDSNNNIYQSNKWSISTLSNTFDRQFYSMIYKYDSNLNLVWNKVFSSGIHVNNFGGEIKDILYSKNQLVFVGSMLNEWTTNVNNLPEYMLEGTYENNMFIGALNENGNILWLHDIGQQNTEFPYVLGGNQCGDVYISGRSKLAGPQSNLPDSQFNFELNSVNYGAITGSFMFKLSDSICVTGGCNTLCQDSTLFPNPIISYTDTTLITSNYTTFQWFFNGDTISGATNQTYDYNQNGEYSVSVTDIAGCIGSNSLNEICLNPLLFQDTLVYYDNNIIGTGLYNSYQWIINGSTVIGATNQTYNYSENGQYSVIVTDSNQCTNELFLTETCLNQSYVLTPTININNTTLSTSSNYAEYQWFLDGISIPGAINQSYVFNQYGNYTVSIVDNFGCSDTSLVYLVDGAGLKINEINKVNIFPNPATNELTISNLISFETFNVEIIDLNGKVCKTISMNSNDLMKYKIKINELEKGVYYIKISDSRTYTYLKFIKI